MKKYIVVFGFCLACVFSVNAQYPSAVSTIVTDSARYEIIQSPIKRSLTFMLDKFTGSVYQLVRTSTDDLTWEPMYSRGLSTVQLDIQLYPRFQIFLGGMMVADTYLLDTKEGDVWQLQESKDGQLTWNPIQ